MSMSMRDCRSNTLARIADRHSFCLPCSSAFFFSLLSEILRSLRKRLEERLEQAETWTATSSIQPLFAQISKRMGISGFYLVLLLSFCFLLVPLCLEMLKPLLLVVLSYLLHLGLIDPFLMIVLLYTLRQVKQYLKPHQHSIQAHPYSFEITHWVEVNHGLVVRTSYESWVLQ